jgi:hypothetical protein
MKQALIKLIVLTGILFDLAAAAQVQYAHEFWISSIATGNIYPSGGTLANPLDGSTEAKFDENMKNLPENSVIHILAGTYETWGSYAWSMQTGQKILGSGRDNTILQLPLGTPQHSVGTSVIYSQGIVTNGEIADLTLDCNWQGQGYTYGGISIDGTGNIVSRVRVIHCGFTAGVSSEAFGIGLDNNNLPTSQGNIIEDCEVSEFSGGPGITAIVMCGTPTNYMTGIIRNNVVILPASSSVDGFGINGSWVSDMLVEGNYIYGALNGIYSDTGGWTDSRILNNTLRNCFNGVAIFPQTATLKNLTAAFNKIDLVATNNYMGAAFDFSGAAWTNIFLFGNTVDFYNAGSSPSILVAADGVTGLVFENNFVDPQLAGNQLNTPYFTNVINLTIDNNYDLFGTPLSALNTSTMAGDAVSPFGLSLIASAQASSALISLGLPGNPQELVTNDQSGLTLSGAFSGNGSGLTNLSWNNVTGTPAFARYSDPAPTFTNGMNLGVNTAYKINGYNVLWASNFVGIGDNFVVGREPPGVVPNGLGNLLVGSYAMQGSTNANGNTMVGINAGRGLLSSTYNTIVGYDAGCVLKSGADNTFVGNQSGYGNGSFTIGNQNTLIGDSSLYRAQSGNNNVALGYMAGSFLSAGSNNVFIAHQGTSAEANSSGTIYIGDPGVQTSAHIAGTVYGNGSGLTNLSWNNIIGLPPFARYSDPAPTFTNGMNINAGLAYKIGGINILWASNSAGNFVAGNTVSNVIPNGIANTIVGEGAMQYSTSANNNTMIGNSAGLFLLSSSANTMVGKNAGMDMTHGSDNVIVGYQAGYGNGSYTNGNQNTLIGDSSLYRARTGDNNVALGYMAGSFLSAGSNNVFIAHQGTSSETNSSGTIYIGDPGVQTSAYIAGTVHAGGGITGSSLIATNGFQCSTNYTPSLWTPVPGSVILRASNNWMFAISQYSTNAAFQIGP